MISPLNRADARAEQYCNCWMNGKWYGPEPPPEGQYHELRPQLSPELREKGMQAYRELAAEFPNSFCVHWEFDQGPYQFEDEHGAGWCAQQPREVHSMMLFNEWGTMNVDVRSPTLLLDMAIALDLQCQSLAKAAAYCRKLYAIKEGGGA